MRETSGHRCIYHQYHQSTYSHVTLYTVYIYTILLYMRRQWYALASHTHLIAPCELGLRQSRLNLDKDI